MVSLTEIRFRNFSRTVVYYDKEIARKLNRFMSISVLSVFVAVHRAVN